MAQFKQSLTSQTKSNQELWKQKSVQNRLFDYRNRRNNRWHRKFAVHRSYQTVQNRSRVRKRALSIHCTLLPYLPTSGELKTKPSQHSVTVLRSYGLQPEILVYPERQEPSRKVKRKIGSILLGAERCGYRMQRYEKYLRGSSCPWRTEYGLCCASKTWNGRQKTKPNILEKSCRQD